MKHLFLYRHADTLAAGDRQSDHERMLSEQGRQECARVGRYLKEARLLPQTALCSTALRTRTTLELTLQAAETTLSTVFINALYLAAPGDILREVNALDNAHASALLVAHNPGIHHLCRLLAHSGKAEDLRALERHFPPATLAIFRLETNDWRQITPHTPAELETFLLAENL